MNKYDWLSRLVAFDTVSKNSNLDLIHCIQEWFSKYNIHSQLINDSKEPKANLFATIPAHNGDKTGGLILSGHTDVVPVEGQNWDTNPFETTRIGDKIFGRGTCDMKGFIAIALSLVPEFLKLKLQQPIHFAFSYDEEIGCRGAPFMIKEMVAANIRPTACLVGEPTDMRPVIAHKGKQTFRCSVHGVAAHSSLTPQGCNAIEYAARLICFVRDLADQYREKGPFDDCYDVPFTTLTTNLIKGGNAQNTIPAFCEFIFEFRALTQDQPKQIRKQIDDYIQKDLLPKMQNENASANIVLDMISGAPGLDASEDADLTQLVRSITGEKDKIKVAYGTEAGLFQQALVPTIICGPGSIEQAHRANEYIEVEQMEKCELFLMDLVKKYAL